MSTRKTVRSILGGRDDTLLLKVGITDPDLGLRFETGVPVEFPYMRRKAAALRPGAEDRFRQRLEPAGRYMLLDTMPDSKRDALDLEKGWMRFDNPLVIAFHPGGEVLYRDPLNWKNRLYRYYGRKRGKRLSRAVVADGYDGIVTISLRTPPHTEEIVDLTMF